jgi:hypothetical protein
MSKSHRKQQILPSPESTAVRQHDQGESYKKPSQVNTQKIPIVIRGENGYYLFRSAPHLEKYT